MADEFTVNLGGNPIKHLEQYMGLWAIHGPFMDSALAQVQAMNLAQHIQQAQLGAASVSPTRFYSVQDGVGVIELRGAMLKYGSSLSEAPSSIELIRAVRSATRDDKVKSLVIVIDSPGGTVAGTSDLAGAVAKAAQAKPVYAYIEDMAASAAYWVASQATKVFANSSAQIGNIGTFIRLQDTSKQEENEGRKTIVIKAGEYKAIGVPGAPITDDQIAHIQAMINDVNALFVGAVQKGRKFTAEQVAAVADGRIHIGANAIKVGLIDQIAELSDVMEMAQGNMAKKMKGKNQMEAILETTQLTSGEPLRIETPLATYADLKERCKGADPAFICGQLERKATLDEAVSAWMTEQNARIETAKAETIKAQTPKIGVEPRRSLNANKEEASEDVGSEPFHARIRELMATGIDRRKATVRAAKQLPEAHLAFLRETNLPRVHHLIDDRA